jgi:hypothetical protein
MSRARFTGRRRWLALAIIVAVVAGVGVGGALAAFPDSDVETYTGCLNNGGQVGKVAVGLSPKQACSSQEKLVHLGGGDITKVTAGTGLTGGGDNGAVTLSLNAGHSLPQDCTNGQVAKSNGSNVWNCANDNDTTYTAGTGLDLSGTQFSIDEDYRVQNTPDCSSGQFATGFNSSGVIQCSVPPTTLASIHTGNDTSLGDTKEVILQDVVPTGSWVFIVSGSAGANDEDSDIIGGCELRTTPGNVLLGSTGFAATDPSDDFNETWPISITGALNVTGNNDTVQLLCNFSFGENGSVFAQMLTMRVGSIEES